MASATQGPVTPDRKGLGIIGFVLGGVTAAVVLIAAISVHAHTGDERGFDDRPAVAPSSFAR